MGVGVGGRCSKCESVEEGRGVRADLGKKSCEVVDERCA